jgi:hypothetical protein
MINTKKLNDIISEGYKPQNNTNETFIEVEAESVKELFDNIHEEVQLLDEEFDTYEIQRVDYLKGYGDGHLYQITIDLY